MQGVAIEQVLISCREFEENMTLLMLGIFPTLIASRAYYGRAAIKAAFTKYYAEKNDMEASALIKNRLASCRQWGFGEEDIANFEISTLFLATTNTVPTSFWQLSYILADTEIHARIRKEVESIVQRKKGKDGKDEALMDVTLFQTHCPLLSTFHETLRLVDAATSVRAVVQPTTLTSSNGMA